MGDRGFEWKSVEYVLTPEDGATVNVVRDGWWVTRHGGTDVLFWYGHREGDVGSPQMNRDKKIAEIVAARLATPAELTQIPLAFYPVALGDY